MLLATGCGGAPGTAPTPPATPAPPACPSASDWNGRECQPFARRMDTRAPTAFVEDGRPVTLEVVIFLPFGAGPFPTVVFHHGSTGNGTDPSLFRATYTSEVAARFFAERGYAVVFPQRRGRGQSDGLYDEGFTPDRSRYSCLLDGALAGLDHALLDADAALDFVRARTEFDPSRVIGAGLSRGGVLSIAHAGRRPTWFKGVVNFVGGWLGEGCVDAVPVNRAAFARGGPFPRPTVWLYADNDSFYSLPHSRANFAAFLAAGGRGSFLAYARAPALNGHFLINDPQLWTTDLDSYLRTIDP